MANLRMIATVELRVDTGECTEQIDIITSSVADAVRNQMWDGYKTGFEHFLAEEVSIKPVDVQVRRED